MSLALIKAARAASTLCAAVIAAAYLVLQLSSHAAGIPVPEASRSPQEILVFEQMRVPRWLAETVVRAAQVTGVDPAYLMALADKESSLLLDNKARTSSAEGLFQFVEGTWLEVLRRYGPKHGYAAEAEAIQVVQGRSKVSDSDERERILNLRRDPYLSALMAGEMMNAHRQVLAGQVARDPSFAELYMAHFLGVQGASRFGASPTRARLRRSHARPRPTARCSMTRRTRRRRPQRRAAGLRHCPWPRAWPGMPV